MLNTILILLVIKAVRVSIVPFIINFLVLFNNIHHLILFKNYKKYDINQLIKIEKEF